MTPHSPGRVLITGVSNPLGAEVARRLAPQVPHLFGCDVADPVSALEEMDFVHADTRLSVIGKLVRQLRIDTVVHLAVMVDSPRDERSIHETDVIGTMNVLVGCAAPSSPVRRLVVKSSQAIYGAGAGDPSFFSEEMINWDKLASGITRDLLEMEQLVSEFALRTDGCGVTVLRLGYRVSEDTSLARFLSLPIVPVFTGFDPRLQLLHEEDAAEAIVRATVRDHPGAFNVAGDGVILLSQAIDIMGGRPAPILPPYGRWVDLAVRAEAVRARGPAGAPGRLHHLRFGHGLLPSRVGVRMEAVVQLAADDGRPRAGQEPGGHRSPLAPAGVRAAGLPSAAAAPCGPPQ